MYLNNLIWFSSFTQIVNEEKNISGTTIGLNKTKDDKMAFSKINKMLNIYSLTNAKV